METETTRINRLIFQGGLNGMTELQFFAAVQSVHIGFVFAVQGNGLPHKIVGFLIHHQGKLVVNQPIVGKKVIRHELVHAFLFESGLSVNSWADNEEIVDWIAIQFS